jgi:glyoxylase I family protein
METIISDLLGRFEKGSLSRRDLVRGLAILAAGGTAAGAQEGIDFKTADIDHVSIQVADLQRSIDFYQKIFGLKVINEDKPNEISRMGPETKIIVSLHHKEPFAKVDHFAIAIEGFDKQATTAALAAHGLKAEENLDYGFFVRDPEGMPVQIVAA